MNCLRVGIIGCGWTGEQHIRAYRSLKDVAVLAAADINERKAKRFATKWKVKAWYKDYRMLLKNPEIDAVSICVPHHLHSKISVEAAEMGKHILCEKPLAISLKEADKMIKAAEKAGIILMVAENVRFHPINLKIKELIDEGFIGEVFLARIFRDHEIHEYLRARPWFLDKKKAGGGIWISGGIHDVDALRMLLGEVEEISMFQAKKVFLEMEGEDTVAAIMKFKSGAVGVMTESFSTKVFKQVSPLGCPYIVNGSDGTIMTHSNYLDVYSEKMGEPSVCMRIRVEERDTFIEEIKHFINCIKREENPITSGEEEWKTLAVICAGYKSLKKGGVPVKVKY